MLICRKKEVVILNELLILGYKTYSFTNENTGIYIVLKIAKALNVPVESLFTLEDV